MEIRRDDLTHPSVHALLEEHLRDMHAWSPPESVHALDLSGLQRPDVAFWGVWEGELLLGCGALKLLSPQHGEIKSMRTADAHRRRGVARAMLEHILEEARRRGLTRLSLETGAQPQFEPARALYRRYGFADCDPFGGYTPDPNSTFMTRTLGVLPAEHRTEHLLFRPWRADDAERLLPLLEAKHSHLSAWLPRRVTEPAPLSELRERLGRFAEEYGRGLEWRLGLFTPDGARILGEVSMFPRDATRRVDLDAADQVELGYWIRADASALVTEAVRGALELAAAVPRFRAAVIRCDERNADSAAVPRQLGFMLTDRVAKAAGATCGEKTMMQEWRSPLP